MLPGLYDHCGQNSYDEFSVAPTPNYATLSLIFVTNPLLLKAQEADKPEGRNQGRQSKQVTEQYSAMIDRKKSTPFPPPSNPLNVALNCSIRKANS